MCVSVCEVTTLPFSGFLRTVLCSPCFRPFTSRSIIRMISILTTLTATQVTRMSSDLTKPFCDKFLMYNYPFTLMFILNTRHSMSPDVVSKVSIYVIVSTGTGAIF